MKTIYVMSINHLDPVWRRCFEDHCTYEGNVIRPYSDIEEALLDQWISLMEQSGFKHSIEQSLTVKKYLERNPDGLELLRDLIHQGRLEPLGGGETVIDYNLVHGESIVRSHLYSILWYRDVLGCIPKVGIAPDTFGLSAQLPQIYRKLGYPSLIRYSRVLQKAKPYWKGLDGSLVYIKQDYGDMGVPKLHQSDVTKYAACPSCLGEGCSFCDDTGIDYSFRNYTRENRLEQAFDFIQNSSEDRFIMMFDSEETLQNDDLIERLEKGCDETGARLEYITYAEMLDMLAEPYLQALENGSVNQEDIDERVEGNPVFTGCYISRVELKKLNRLLEDLLLSCEKFATFAADYGMAYPRKKIERLWNKMSFIQFHDCITGSHLDAGYEEIKKVARDVRLGAAQIYREAMKFIERRAAIPEREGHQAFLVFNPLNWEVRDAVLETVIRMEKGSSAGDITIEDAEGSKQHILDIQRLDNRGDVAYKVKFKGASLPSIGYKTFYYRVEQQQERAALQEIQTNHIENEYYRIQVGPTGISGIWDQETGEKVLLSGAGNLLVEEDYGSPWDTLVIPTFRESVADPFFHESVVARDYQVSVRIEGDGYQQKIVLEGKYSFKERKINSLLWKQEITLYKGSRRIHFKTDVDWDAVNSRLMVSFPLSFKTPGDEGYYEIPYGTLKRKAYAGYYGINGCANGDWPVLNFVSCYHEEKDYTISLINKGTPCCQIQDGVIYMSLLRSPDIPYAALDFGGAQEKGKHSFEYVLVAHKGNLKAGKTVQTGLECNTQFMSCMAETKEGELESVHSFIRNESSNVILSSIKRAEDGEGKILRMVEAYGESVNDTVQGVDKEGLKELNLLEEEARPISGIHFQPFEIKTLALSCDSDGGIGTR